MPENFIWEKPSRKNNGNVWVDPKNPKGDRIRVIPGGSDQGPYAKVTKNGSSVDQNGFPVRAPTGKRPSQMPEAHIPLDKLKDVYR